MGHSVDMTLKGQTVFVTEAPRHFGTPMALALAREGVTRLLVTPSDPEPLAHTAHASAGRCLRRSSHRHHQVP